MDEPSAPAEDVVRAMRRLVAEGLCTGTAGNASVRAADRLVISPSGVAPAALDPDRVAVLDDEGHRLSGDAPSSELALHRLVYDVTGCGAIVHTHSPMATTIATTHAELPAVHYAIVALGGPVRVAPYARFGSDELARAVAEAIRDRQAVLLANHGAVTVGPTLEAAVEHAVLLEWLCGLYWRALQVGTPRILSAAQLDEVRAEARRLGYRALLPDT